MAKPRIKKPAQVKVPQNRDEAEQAMTEAGVIERQLEAIETGMNEAIAEAKKSAEDAAAPLRDRAKTLGTGLTTWAESNRAELTQDGKVKTAMLGTGEIRWWMGKRSVTVRGMVDVLERLKTAGLGRFVRTKKEVDKELILKTATNRLAVASIPGLNVKEPVESIEIIPHRETLSEVNA